MLSGAAGYGAGPEEKCAGGGGVNDGLSPGSPGSTRPAEAGHWSDSHGSLAMLRSLLVKEASAADCDMRDWYLAVIESVEHEVATNRSNAVMFARCEEDFFESVATKLYIAGRKGFESPEG